MTMSGEKEEEYKDSIPLLTSSNANTVVANANIENNGAADHHTDLEAQDSSIPVHRSPRSYPVSPVGFKDLLIKHLDRCFSSSRRLSFKRHDRDIDRSSTSVDPGPRSPSPPSHHYPHTLHNLHFHHRQQQLVDSSSDTLGDSAPPEWALLLIGCLLGLATGLFVAAFNNGVHVIHEWAWAGTPNDGAAWLRLQRLADTWHRILLIPVTGVLLLG